MAREIFCAAEGQRWGQSNVPALNVHSKSAKVSCLLQLLGEPTTGAFFPPLLDKISVNLQKGSFPALLPDVMDYCF